MLPLTMELWRLAGGELGPESELLLQSTAENKHTGSILRETRKLRLYSKTVGGKVWGGGGGLKINNDPLTTVEPKTHFTFFTIIYEFWKEGLVKDLNTGTLYANIHPNGPQNI